MPFIADSSGAARLEPFNPFENDAVAGPGQSLRAPTPAKGCSVHAEMQSREGALFGLLRIHQVPPAAPAQTGTECRFVLPREALEELYGQLRDLLERYPS